MKNICPMEQCTGCMACCNSCAHQAIVVTEDVYGFRYPVIEENKCVDCGLCTSVCPVNFPVGKRESLTVYAAYSRNNDDRMSSTSGGASSVFAQVINGRGGVVYGCVQKAYYKVKHARIENKDELYKLKGSKYVQSDIGDIFRLVRKDLSEGKQVLFTGTPCQIAGLRSFLHKEYESLITVDLICHGVPSVKLLQDNVKEVLKRKKIPQKAYQVFFRTKGEHESDLKFGTFLYANIGNAVQPIVTAIKYPHDYYITGFMCGLFHRESCYSCSYANARRVSDITIGDYWGIGKSSLDTGKGISAILLNTEKGVRFFECCKDKLVHEEREVNEAVRGNGQLQYPSVKNKNYRLFRELYPRRGFTGSARRCLYPFYMRYYGIDLIKSELIRVPFVYRFCKVLKNIFKYS